MNHTVYQNVLNQAKRILYQYNKDKINTLEERYPWRKSWQFVLYHCFRVDAYAKRIIDIEKNIDDVEELLIRTAAILHDICRISHRDEHAKCGAELVHQELKNSNKEINKYINIDRLTYLIAFHSQKHIVNKERALAILQDADTLDEIGMLSVCMAFTRIDVESPHFFNLLCERINDYELDFIKKKMNILNTRAWN